MESTASCTPVLYSSMCQAFLLTYEMWWRCLQEATYCSSGQLHCCLWNYPGWGLNWTQEPCPLFQTWVMKASLLVPSNSQCSMVDPDQRNLSMGRAWLSFLHDALVCHGWYLSPLWKTAFQSVETFAFEHWQLDPARKDKSFRSSEAQTYALLRFLLLLYYDKRGKTHLAHGEFGHVAKR